MGLLFQSSTRLKTELQSSVSSRRVRGELFLFDPSNGESRGLTAHKLEVSDVFRVFDVKGCASDLFVLGPGNQQHPEEAPSRGERWSKDKVGEFPLT